MIDGADPRSQDYEKRRDCIADPHTYPRLPPRQPNRGIKRRRGNHPRVDVERIRDPETDKVEGFPLASLGLDGLEIVVG